MQKIASYPVGPSCTGESAATRRRPFCCAQGAQPQTRRRNEHCVDRSRSIRNDVRHRLGARASLLAVHGGARHSAGKGAPTIMIHGYWRVSLLSIFTVGIISGLLNLYYIAEKAYIHLKKGHQQEDEWMPTWPGKGGQSR